jgi:Zn-dependent metalloprotease
MTPRAMLILFSALLISGPAQGRNDKPIKSPSPGNPRTQARVRSLNLAPLTRVRQSIVPQFRLSASQLRTRMRAGKVVPTASHPGTAWSLWKDEKNDTPVFLQLNRRPAGKTAATGFGPGSGAEQVIDFIQENASLFRLRDPRNELVVTDARGDAQGTKHVSFDQHYMGVPVWGSQLVGHLDASGLYALNSRYVPTPDYVDQINPRTTSEAAVDRALEDLTQRRHVTQFSAAMRQFLEYDGPRAHLYLWSKDPDSQLALAWRVEIRANAHERWRYFIDDRSGEILDHYQASPADGPAIGSGVDLRGDSQPLHTLEQDGLFYLIDGTRPDFELDDSGLSDPKGALWTLDAGSTDMEEIDHVVSADNVFTDPAAVSAHANMALVYDYFYTSHGRLGINNDGSTVISVVHVTDGGESMENAYWNGVAMAYGDGGVSLGPLAAALDIAAHEMTHGIIERTVNLEYRFQQGALNESFADIFGAMVDSDDWLLGEDIVNPDYYPSGAMRDMQHPHNGDETGGYYWQPEHMSEYQELAADNDNGGVHTNSGIPNRAAFLLSEAIGRESAARIYYRILDAAYLSARSQFVDCRLAAEQAARDLFGDDSPELQAVRLAYDTVGITAPGEPDEPSVPPIPDDKAQNWIATVAAELDGDNSLWLAKPATDFDEQWQYIKQLTATQVFAETGNAITTSRNADFLFFIDSDNNLRSIGLDGSGEEIINDDGDWGSIALSPDASKLAATTIYEDSTIFYFDLEEPSNSRGVKLTHWTTQDGVTQDITRFADAVQWDASSSLVIYDAFSSLTGPDGSSIDFWEVNVLDPISGSGFTVFPPQPEGVHIANPSLSTQVLADGSINDCRLLYERVDENREESQIRVLDACTGKDEVLHTFAAPVFSFPHFMNNDREIVFEAWLEDDAIFTANLWRLALTADSLHPVGTPHFFVPNSQSPFSFTVEDDALVVATSVEEEDGPTVPQAFSLQQNVPNPFNPETTISFDLPDATEIDLHLYNPAGQHVAILATGFHQAGSHTLRWDGRDGAGRALASGVYLYRLTTADRSETRKLMLLR